MFRRCTSTCNTGNSVDKSTANIDVQVNLQAQVCQRRYIPKKRRAGTVSPWCVVSYSFTGTKRTETAAKYLPGFCYSEDFLSLLCDMQYRKLDGSKYDHNDQGTCSNCSKRPCGALMFFVVFHRCTSASNTGSSVDTRTAIISV